MVYESLRSIRNESPTGRIRSAKLLSLVFGMAYRAVE